MNQAAFSTQVSTTEDTDSQEDEPSPSSIQAEQGLWGRVSRLYSRLLRPEDTEICASIAQSIDAPPLETILKPETMTDISAEQSRMIENIRRLSEKRVTDIMVPRADIIAVDCSTKLQNILEAFHIGFHSRILVYGDSLDDARGFLHVKDLLSAYGTNFIDPENCFVIEKHLRDLLFVPPSANPANLMAEMRQKRKHFAVVVDEYGGVDGLVTFSDLIEEVMGDISDEHDAPEMVSWERQADGSYMCDARAFLEEFETEIGLKLIPETADDEEIETIGGLVLMLCAGRVPNIQDEIPHPDGHRFKVLDAEPRFIRQLQIFINPDINKTPPTTNAV